MNRSAGCRVHAVAITAILSLISATSWAAAVAMVLDVQGKITASRDRQPFTVGIAVSLQDGTEISLAEGAKLVLTHYQTKSHMSFSGPVQFRVGEKDVRKLSGAEPLTRKLPVEATRTAQGFKGRVVPAAMVMKGAAPSVVLRQPLAGESVLDDQLEISWTSTQPEVRFQVFAGKRLVGEKRLSGNQARLADIAVLEPGKSYRMVASAGGKDLAISFRTLSKPQQNALAKLKPAADAALDQWVVYAMALEQAGAASSARAIWRKVSQQRQGAGDQVVDLAE